MRWPRMLVCAGAVLLALWALAPLYWVVVSSVSTRTELYAAPYKHWLPAHPTLVNYVDVFTTGPRYRAGGFLPSATILASGLRNSLVIALVSAATITLLASLAGYVFARLRIRLKGLFFLGLLSLLPLPIWVSLISLYFLLSKVNLVDTDLGMILIFVAYGLPLYVWLMQTYIVGTPKEVEEAALMDGAGRLKALVHVVLPIARAGLVSVFLVAFLTTWNAFLVPLIFSNTEASQPLTVVLSLFIGQYEVAWEAMSAAAVVTMLPPILLALFFQRYLVRGLSMGALQ